MDSVGCGHERHDRRACSRRCQRSIARGASSRADSSGRFVFRDITAGHAFGCAPSRSATSQPTRPSSFTAAIPSTVVASSSHGAAVARAGAHRRQESPERTRFEEQATPSVVSISGAEVRRVPAIGESDVLRSAALLPGVVARNDFSAGFNVRGGEADQNLVLLDGIPIYNPFHLGGLFGTFIDKAVSGVDVLTGAFPSRYGGRLSSVLDVKSLEETRHGAHGTAEISLLSSSLFRRRDRSRGKLSWNVAVRRTYADKVVEWIRGSNDFPYHFQDAQLRARLAAAERRHARPNDVHGQGPALPPGRDRQLASTIPAARSTSPTATIRNDHVRLGQPRRRPDAGSSHSARERRCRSASRTRGSTRTSICRASRCFSRRA